LQIINDTTLDLNFFPRYYKLGLSYLAVPTDIIPSTFQNAFTEGCDDGNLISGDGCSGCNYRSGSTLDDGDVTTNSSIFGLPFPFACSCTPANFGTYFCPKQA
jgi:cysteine-rich repeat protein